MPDFREILKFEVIGVLAVGASLDQAVMPFNGEIVNAAAQVTVAGLTTNIVCDLLKNGVSIYTTVANRPTVVAGALVSSAANRALQPDVTKFVAGDVLSLSLTSVGTTTTGSNLDVTVQYIST